MGNTHVPTELDTAEFPKLGGWVAMQRQAYKNEMKRKSGAPGRKGAHRISDDQIAKLEGIGFDWVVNNRENRGWKSKFGASGRAGVTATPQTTAIAVAKIEPTAAQKAAPATIKHDESETAVTATAVTVTTTDTIGPVPAAATVVPAAP